MKDHKSRMLRARRHRRQKQVDGMERRTAPGASPGSVVIDPEAPRPVIRVMAFRRDALVESTPAREDEIVPLLNHWPVVWVNVDGLGDASVIRRLGDIFHIHILSLEDVVNVHQRAKVEQYDDYYFIVGRMAEIEETLRTEQLSLFLGKNWVLTFQEKVGDCFDPVRERIRKEGSRIRSSGPDYLAYAILDAFVDNYFPVLEEYGERLESLEDDVILRPANKQISQIHGVKRELLALRRAVWPLREAMSGLLREKTPLIADETRIYLRDCYDHTIQIIDLLENYRDVASSLMEVYLSSLSNRMNEIMKVLTMFASIFIPLTFIAGVYGMNFNTSTSRWNMPELNWVYGYPFALGLMGILVVCMLIYFKRKDWL